MIGMTIELKKKIEELIQAHKDNNDNMNSAMKETIEQFYSPGALNTYKKEFVSEQVQKEFADARKAAEQVDALLNRKLKEIIEAAKKAMIPEYFKQAERSSDHAAKVSNALQFLMIEDGDLTDESAYLILKDFLDDYDQMLLFKKAIGKKNALVDSSGNTTFPRTFGKLNQMEAVLNLFNEVETMANNLFMHPRYEAETYIFNNQMFATLSDGYQEGYDEKYILDFAEKLERISNKVNGEGDENTLEKHPQLEN
jgi:hypothetical protein